MQGLIPNTATISTAQICQKVCLPIVCSSTVLVKWLQRRAKRTMRKYIWKAHSGVKRSAMRKERFRHTKLLRKSMIRRKPSYGLAFVTQKAKVMKKIWWKLLSGTARPQNREMQMRKIVLVSAMIAVKVSQKM